MTIFFNFPLPLFVIIKKINVKKKAKQKKNKKQKTNMKSAKSNKSRNHHCSGKLTHFGPTFHFYTPWKCRLTLGLDACKSVKKTPIFYMYYCFGKGFHIRGCSPLDLPLISSDEFDINASLGTHKLENLRSTLEFKIL